MSQQGFLGALSGLGKGAAEIGGTMMQDTLARRREAETSERAARIAEHKRKADNQDWDRQYGVQRGAALEDYQRNLTDKRADSETAHQRDLEKLRLQGDMRAQEAEAKAKADAEKDKGIVAEKTYNAFKGGLRDMFAKMDPAGNFFMPEGSDKEYGQALEIGNDLLERGYSIGRATNMAYTAIRGPLSLDEAKQKAEVEAGDKFGWTEGDKKAQFVEQRANELVAESQAALKEYQSVSGKQPTPSGFLSRSMSEPSTQQPPSAAEPASPARQQTPAPAAAIDYLRKNPQFKEAFKAKYGYLPEGM